MGATVEIFKLNCVEGRWHVDLDLDRKGRADKETYACDPIEHPAQVKASDVVCIRPITKEDRDVPFGPKEEDGIPGIFPLAQTLIETTNDKLYVTENLEALLELIPTPEARANLTQFQKLTLAVAELNPRAVELPGRAGLTLVGAAEAEKPKARDNGFRPKP